MKRRTSLVLAALLVAVGLATSTGSAQADSTCEDGYSCFWTGDNFTGAKRLVGAEWYGRGWQKFDNPKNSIKVHFTNKVIWVYDPKIGYECGNPGQRGEKFPGGITWFMVDSTCAVGVPARYFHY